jgi:hypothetical protein
MSTDETQEVKAPANWYVIGGVAGAAVGLVLFGLLLMGRTPTRTVPTTPAGEGESDLEAARQLLIKASGTSASREALTHVNTHFSRSPQARPPALDKAQAAALRQQVGLDPGEVEEITGSTFSRMDAHYLEHCFLLRDAARWLDGRPTGKAGPPGLEQASSAFDWVVRQARSVGQGGSPWIPPVLILRQGWGTDLDRALIFLELLEQVGSPDGKRVHLHGCLLLLPDAPRKPRLWACGVVVGDGKDVYLFDPRLGLALPGPGGKGIATLAEARDDRKGAEVFDQLADKDHRYDVTPQQARDAEVCLVCPLSGLAPRMKYLQDEVLAPAVEVRLARDVSGELARLRAAVGAERESAVKVWPEGTGILRRYLSTNDGGVDKPAPYPLRNLPGFSLPDDPTVVLLNRQQRSMFEMVPWPAFPRVFQNHRDFPYNAGLGQRVRDDFVRPFVNGNLEGNQPRDLLLRGQPANAAQVLVGERDHWAQKRKLPPPDKEAKDRIDAWKERALAVYAGQLRARTQQEQEAAARAINELWKDANDVRNLLESALSGPRGAEVVYQLGLCKQEQAERLQARIDRAAGKAGAEAHPADVDKAQDTWRDALNWWKEFAEGYAGDPAQPAGRRLRGRAQAMLGDWQGAVASWQDLSGDMTGPEKLASLYRARRLAAHHGK